MGNDDAPQKQRQEAMIKAYRLGIKTKREECRSDGYECTENEIMEMWQSDGSESNR